MKMKLEQLLNTLFGMHGLAQMIVDLEKVYPGI
jgi:hypothetical protein